TAPAVDAPRGFALLSLQHAQLLLCILTLRLKLRELPGCTRHGALGLGKRLRRFRTACLRTGHLLLQVADALLQISQIRTVLVDLAGRRLRLRGRDAPQGANKPGADEQSTKTWARHAASRTRWRNGRS